MAQQSSMCVDLAEGWSLVPITHVQQLTPASSPSLKGMQRSWLPWAPALVHKYLYTDIYTCTHNMKNNKSKSYKNNLLK